MSIVKLSKVNIYQNSHLVLANVELKIDKGEFVYMIGKTGSGKSSLLKLLYGDLELTSGDGEVAGYDLRKLKHKDVPFLRRKIGIVFQDFQLLGDRSAHDNLKFVLKCTGWDDVAKMDTRINEILERVGLKGFKRPNELSGGEQQRLVIARALLNEPELIIADEPTGNLDPETSVDIMNLLFEISKSGSTILMATHNYFLIERFPSRVLRCDNGKIEEF
ncbi:MAG: ATP-binding cassette domain-containing protein [Bacteroidetes bacterium]|nr:ATP-binding cassette domain-containing protein [Bacteroidota bacterium]